MPSAPLNVGSLIAKKRDGGELTSEEIKAFVQAVANSRNGAIQESQIGALLMAIYINGMTDSETVTLTRSMVESGSTIGPYPEEWRHLVVDKHSTGGVGDKTSIVLVPALIACGLRVPMISGRGLGHTGGTVDKLEYSIKGYNVSLTPDQVLEAVTKVGGCMAGQSGDLCPADRVLYAHRDITATVTSPPLILGSIISKKTAENLSSLILDVKFGRGGQFIEEAPARQLAEGLADLARRIGTPTTALLTRNDSPLGLNIGNTAEIAECIECLRFGPEKAPAQDTIYVVSHLGGHLLKSVGKVNDFEEGRQKILESLKNGSALKAFYELCLFQGADVKVAEKLILGKNTDKPDPRDHMPRAEFVEELRSSKDGVVEMIDSRIIGLTLQRLGAGRLKSNDVIDPAVGIQLTFPESPVKGQCLKAGQVWGKLYHNGQAKKDDVKILEKALIFCDPKNENYCPGKNYLEELIADVI